MGRYPRRPGFFARRAARRTTLGPDCWIGHGAIVRPEVTVGAGAVVAAGAVVTKDVPPYMIVAGIPASPLRARFPEAIAAADAGPGLVGLVPRPPARRAGGFPLAARRSLSGGIRRLTVTKYSPPRHPAAALPVHFPAMTPDPSPHDRRSWMGLLARARPATLAALAPDPLPDHALLRRPETGAVMVRGRMGGTGPPSIWAR